MSDACLLAALGKPSTTLPPPDERLMALQALLSLCRSNADVFLPKHPLPTQIYFSLQEHTAKEMKGSHGPDHTSAAEPRSEARGKAKRAD